MINNLGNLRAGLASEEGFQLRPFPGLGLADEGERRPRKDRVVTVEAFAGYRHIAVFEEVGFDDRLESGFAGPFHGFNSSSERGRPDCRIIDLSVPARNAP